MNAILKKERRSLRTSFLATLLATVSSALIFNGNDALGFIIAAYVMGAVLMAASVFGNEFQTRTLPLLLTQPIPRRQIWLNKMGVLGVALLLSFGVLLWSFIYSLSDHLDFPTLKMLLPGLILVCFIPLCAFCSTPFFSLQIKNFLLSAATTIVWPWFLVFLVIVIDEGQSMLLHRKHIIQMAQELHPTWLYCMIGAAAFGYCAALYGWGYRTFMNFQIIDSQVQELTLPAALEHTLGSWATRLIPGYSRPFASLVRKELRLQRVSYMIAWMVAIAVPLLYAMWKIHNSIVLEVLITIALVMSSFLIPVLSAVATVAEERNLGVMTWQLTLPASVRKQWAAKMLVAIFTCAVPGVLLSFAMYTLCEPALNIKLGFDPHSILFFVVDYVMFFSLTVFASTISPNVIRAVIAAFGLLMASGTLVMLACATATSRILHLIGSGIIDPHKMMRNFDLIVITLMVVSVSVWIYLVNRLSFSNFKADQLPARRIWMQITAILLYVGVAAFVFAGLVYLVNTGS